MKLGVILTILHLVLKEGETAGVEVETIRSYAVVDDLGSYLRHIDRTDEDVIRDGGEDLGEDLFPLTLPTTGVNKSGSESENQPWFIFHRLFFQFLPPEVGYSHEPTYWCGP